MTEIFAQPSTVSKNRSTDVGAALIKKRRRKHAPLVMVSNSLCFN
jgi:hypothetical protein